MAGEVWLRRAETGRQAARSAEPGVAAALSAEAAVAERLAGLHFAAAQVAATAMLASAGKESGPEAQAWFAATGDPAWRQG